MAFVKSIHHVGLTVADLERSIAFYRDMLGFELAAGPWRHEGPVLADLTGYPDGVAVRQAFMRIPGTDEVIEILEYTNGGKPIDAANGNAGAAHFAVIVDDIETIYARIEAKGYKFVSAPTRTTKSDVMYGKAAYLIDPDGIRVELYEPREKPRD